MPNGDFSKGEMGFFFHTNSEKALKWKKLEDGPPEEGSACFKNRSPGAGIGPQQLIRGSVCGESVDEPHGKSFFRGCEAGILDFCSSSIWAFCALWVA